MLDSPPEDIHHVLCFSSDLHAAQPSFGGSCTVSKQDYLGSSWPSSQKPLVPFPLPCLWLGSSSADEVDLGVASSGSEGGPPPTPFLCVQMMG